MSHGSASYSYDSNGNLTQKVEGSDTWTYEWDADDRLKRVLKNSVEQARFGYDPLGRRVEKVAGGITTNYVQDTGTVLREARSDGTAYKYLHSRSLDEPLAREDGLGNLTYYHLDGLDSVVKLTNQTGQVVHTYRCNGWGNVEVGASQGGYAFTSREWEPEIGRTTTERASMTRGSVRFLSEGPIWSKGSLYAYVRNNPVNC